MSLSDKNVVFVGGLGSIGYEACKQMMQRDWGTPLGLAYLHGNTGGFSFRQFSDKATAEFCLHICRHSLFYPLQSLYVLDVLDKPEAIQKLQEINPETKVYYSKFDITNKESIKQALADVVSKVKYIDALVNGAGILADPNVELTMNINLIGLINTTFEALQYMDKNKHGRGGVIVNIASVLGLEPCPSAAVYCASKFGIVGFSRSLADPHYYEHTGIAVVTFCPGLTDTPLKNNIGSKYTFDYSKEIAEKLNSSKAQTAEICGTHVAQAVELEDNGAIYISNQETLTKVKPSVYWEPTY